MPDTTRGFGASMQASALLEKLTALLRSRSPQVLEIYPLARYIAYVDQYPEIAALAYRGRPVEEACRDITAMVGDTGLELYHRALVLALIIRATDELTHRNLPEEIKQLYRDNFDRIVRDIELTMDPANLLRLLVLSILQRPGNLHASTHSPRRCQGPCLPAAKKHVHNGWTSRWPEGTPVCRFRPAARSGPYFTTPTCTRRIGRRCRSSVQRGG